MPSKRTLGAPDQSAAQTPPALAVVALESDRIAVVHSNALSMYESKIEALQHAPNRPPDQPPAPTAELDRRRQEITQLDDILEQLDPASTQPVALCGPRTLIAELLYVVLSQLTDELARDCERYWRSETTLTNLRNRIESVLAAWEPFEDLGGLQDIPARTT